MKITSMKIKRDPAYRKTRVFIFLDELKLVGGAVLRHDQFPKAFRKEVLPKVFEKLHLRGSKASWSQKAGCGCGCSPGFILDADRGHSIYVHAKVN